MKKILLALCGMLCTLHALPQAAPPSLTDTTKQAVITRLQASLLESYVYLDTARRMGDYLVQRQQQGAYKAISSPMEFAQTLTTDLRHVYHDGHLSISFDPRLAAVLADTSRRMPPPAGAVPEGSKDNYGIRKIEMLNGNIAYLRADRFWDATGEAKATVRAAFMVVQHCDALIIDLRYNGGGDPEMVQYFCSFLLPPHTHINDLYERKRNHTDTFYTTLVDSAHAFDNKPVYLLTGRRTFSGAEEMSYDLQNQHRVTIVGEVTGGGAHPVGPVPLGHGFVGNIPFARAINPITHTSWEGKGVQPEVVCAAKDALETAELQYYDQQLAAAADEDQRRKLTWAKEFLQAGLQPVQVPADTLQTYAGSFGDRTVKYENGNLFITALGGQFQRLIPLSSTTFKMADYDKVKLTFSDHANLITFEFDDGFVTAVKRR